MKKPLGALLSVADRAKNGAAADCANSRRPLDHDSANTEVEARAHLLSRDDSAVKPVAQMRAIAGPSGALPLAGL